MVIPSKAQSKGSVKHQGGLGLLEPHPVGCQGRGYVLRGAKPLGPLQGTLSALLCVAALALALAVLILAALALAALALAALRRLQCRLGLRRPSCRDNGIHATPAAVQCEDNGIAGVMRSFLRASGVT